MLYVFDFADDNKEEIERIKKVIKENFKKDIKITYGFLHDFELPKCIPDYDIFLMDIGGMGGLGHESLLNSWVDQIIKWIDLFPSKLWLFDCNIQVFDEEVLETFKDKFQVFVKTTSDYDDMIKYIKGWIEDGK